jgi:hypothetical protein
VSGQQLRIYRIAAGHLDEFVDAWERGVEPLRRRFGFSSQAWTVPGEEVFIWLVAHAGDGSFEAADAAYYASSERKALAPDPARWIESSETRPLRPLSVGRSSAGGSAP